MFETPFATGWLTMNNFPFKYKYKTIQVGDKFLYLPLLYFSAEHLFLVDLFIFFLLWKPLRSF